MTYAEDPLVEPHEVQAAPQNIGTCYACRRKALVLIRLNTTLAKQRKHGGPRKRYWMRSTDGNGVIHCIPCATKKLGRFPR